MALRRDLLAPTSPSSGESFRLRFEAADKRERSERAQGRKKNSLLMRKRGERELLHSHCKTLFHNMEHQNPEEYNGVFCAIIGMRPPEIMRFKHALRANARPAILTNRNNYRSRFRKPRASD